MATIAQIETVIVNRCGSQMTKVKNVRTGLPLSVITTGSNPDLADPIGRAVRDVGIPLSDPAGLTPVDADLASVTADQYDEILDRAELRTLKTILRNARSMTVEVSGVMVYNSDFGRQLQGEIKALEEEIKVTWGVARGSATLETIDLGFAEHMRWLDDGGFCPET